MTTHTLDSRHTTDQLKGDAVTAKTVDRRVATGTVVYVGIDDLGNDVFDVQFTEIR